MREIVGEALARHGFHVLQAADGDEVVGLLETTPVDLLVSDIRMPGRDGLDVLSAARELSPQTSCILITGDASLDTARQAAQKGACDYVPKPFCERELMEAVRSAMSRKASEHERAREEHLADLFKLSEDVRSVDDPWEMLRVTTATAAVQTQSEIGCLATLQGDNLVPFTVGVSGTEQVPNPLPEDHLLYSVAETQRPMLFTRQRAAHPLAGSVDILGPDDVKVSEWIVEGLALPLCDGKRSVGAFGVGRTQANRPYSEGDYRLVSVLAAQSGLLVKNADLVESLQQAYLGTIQAMARTLEARDKYTHGHSQRVANLCRRIAAVLDISPGEAETLQLAAGLHDIGKIAVPDCVLNKPGKLTGAEWEAIRAHPVIGADVLAPASFLADALPLVLHHHERYDGTGYPDGIGYPELLSLTYIIVGADAFDAMTSDRPYREALTTEDAIAELSKGSGTQFDPDVVDAMISLFPEAA